MLRECPIDHGCMRGIDVDVVPRGARGRRCIGADAAAVFLDRDGTLIEEVGYLDRVERLALYPWTTDAIRALNRAGLKIVLVTNQSGVARGFFTEAVVDEVHRHMAALLDRPGGARIDAYYYCPHHPDGKVEPYAQPATAGSRGAGSSIAPSRELGIDPARSFVVGDRWLDVGLARTVGARGMLVRTGYGRPKKGSRRRRVSR